jgi:hypothetical protein
MDVEAMEGLGNGKKGRDVEIGGLKCYGAEMECQKSAE